MRPFYVKKIGGRNVICEIDESKFGKNKYNRGHSIKGVWIMGAIERTIEKRIIFEIVEDRSTVTCNDFAIDNIFCGSDIYTDCWKGYSDLKNLGFVHKTVNHSVSFVDLKSGVHTNSIEGSWSALKKLFR